MLFSQNGKLLSRVQQESVLGQLLLDIFINHLGDGIEDLLIEFAFEMKLEGTEVLFNGRI